MGVLVAARQILAGALAALGLALGAAATATAAPTAAIPVSVDRAPLTGELPPGFLGLALEFPTIPQWVYGGANTGIVDPVLLQLIRNLDPVGRPVLRIGGQSGDRAWWPVPGMATPAGVTNTLGPPWTKAAHALAQQLDARLVLSINLEAGSTQVSATEADHLVSGVGRGYIEALELGNEPDLYLTTPWYKLIDGKRAPWYLQAGTPVFARTTGWGPAAYVAEVQRTEPLLPDLPIAGPDAANSAWLGRFSDLVVPHGRVGVLDSHAYALEQCETDPRSSRYPSVPNLLALRASRGIIDGATPYIGLAHVDGEQFRIDEMGSVTCDGRAGVSNTMASALWVIDALFTAARGGVDGVNLHSFPGSLNGLFDLSNASGRWVATVHPLYYGALMFAQADPVGARLLRLNAGASDQVRSWATIGTDHRVRVLLINVGGATTATVHAPAGFGSRDGERRATAGAEPLGDRRGDARRARLRGERHRRPGAAACPRRHGPGSGGYTGRPAGGLGHVADAALPHARGELESRDILDRRRRAQRR